MPDTYHHHVFENKLLDAALYTPDDKAFRGVTQGSDADLLYWIYPTPHEELPGSVQKSLLSRTSPPTSMQHNDFVLSKQPGQNYVSPVLTQAHVCSNTVREPRKTMPKTIQARAKNKRKCKVPPWTLHLQKEETLVVAPRPLRCIRHPCSATACAGNAQQKGFLALAGKYLRKDWAKQPST